MPKFKSREEYEQWKANRLEFKNGADIQPRPNKKPGLILAVGWGFIALSCLMILGGLSGLIWSIQLQQIEFNFGSMESISDLNEMPGIFKLFLFVLRHPMFFAFLLTCFAVLVLIAGIFFLMLKTWAKISLEVFSWIALALFAIIGILWVSFWFSGPESGGGFLSCFGSLVGIFVGGVYAAVPVTAIIVLRRPAVKEAFGQN
jgi:hypothetical protein